MGLQLFILFGIMSSVFVGGILSIPTTLQGPFKPVTVSLDPTLRTGSDDLPNYDPRLVKRVPSIFPEQIMLALSTTPNSMWVSSVTGDAQIGPKVTPLDPSSVRSEVYYSIKSGVHSLKAEGTSVIYSQTYTDKGLLNYTSGIIHHVLVKENQAGGVQFASYKARFAVPSKESGSNNNLYYSFNAGGVHFVILASYTDYNRTSQQYKWLKGDLMQVDRSVTPWLIASWHSPWYNSYNSHYQEFECMRQQMEDLLYEYGVDIAFHGHVKGH